MITHTVDKDLKDQVLIEKVQPIQYASRIGATVLEYILWSALAALIAVGIFQVYSTGQSATKANGMMSEIALINSSVRTVAEGAPDFVGVTNESVSGILPRKYVVDTTKLVNPYKEAVTITEAVNASAIPGSAFKVSTKVPKGDCPRIILGDMGRGTFEIEVEGTTAGTADKRITQTEAQTACGPGDPNSLVNIAWTFQ